jgi:hypothetical protein
MHFCIVLCIVCFVSFPVLFVCICVLYYWVATQLQLTNVSYHIISNQIATSTSDSERIPNSRRTVQEHFEMSGTHLLTRGLVQLCNERASFLDMITVRVRTVLYLITLYSVCNKM